MWQGKASSEKGALKRHREAWKRSSDLLHTWITRIGGASPDEETQALRKSFVETASTLNQLELSLGSTDPQKAAEQ
jgi:hypothetical protein